MADDEPSDNATVQMSPEQVKRLHAELAAAGGKARAAKAAAAAEVAEEALDYPAEAYAQSEDDFTADAEEPPAEDPIYEEEAAPAPAAKPKLDKKVKVEKAPPPKKAEAPKAAPKPKPAPKPVVEGQGGGGLLIVGGIGAIVAGLSVGLPIISQMQGMVGEEWPIIGGTIGMIIGHLLLGLGMFGAVSRTNGVAALVGTLHLLAFAGLTFFALALFRVIELDRDIVQYALLAPAILPGTAWLLSGIWGFASGAGALGVLHGVFSLLGGAAMIATVVGALAGAFGGQDDIAIALAFAGPGCVLIGAIFLAIAMFGRLRQPA